MISYFRFLKINIFYFFILLQFQILIFWDKTVHLFYYVFLYCTKFLSRGNFLYAATNNHYCSVSFIYQVEQMKDIDSLDVEDHLLTVSIYRREIFQDIFCDHESTYCNVNLAPMNYHTTLAFLIVLKSLRNSSVVLIYPFLCHMKIKSCQKQNEIRLLPITNIQKMV